MHASVNSKLILFPNDIIITSSWEMFEWNKQNPICRTFLIHFAVFLSQMSCYSWFLRTSHKHPHQVSAWLCDSHIDTTSLNQTFNQILENYFLYLFKHSSRELAKRCSGIGCYKEFFLVTFPTKIFVAYEWPAVNQIL